MCEFFNHSFAYRQREQRYLRIFLLVVFLLMPTVIFLGTAFLALYGGLTANQRLTWPVIISSAVALQSYSFSFGHIVLVAFSLNSRFSAMNSAAVMDLATTTTSVITADPPPLPTSSSGASLTNGLLRGDKVRPLRILYGVLAETVDEINNGFSLIGLGCTMVAFVVLISSTFANYEAIVGDWRTTSAFLLINVVWCSFYNAFLIGTIIINGRIKGQVSSLQFIRHNHRVQQFSLGKRRTRRSERQTVMKKWFLADTTIETPCLQSHKSRGRSQCAISSVLHLQPVRRRRQAAS